MTPTAIVFFSGFLPALLLGWYTGTIYERSKHVPDTRKMITRDNLLIALVVAALVGAVVAAVYAYGGNASGKTRDEQNITCLETYTIAFQANSTPVTIASRDQTNAFRDYEQGFSLEPPAKNMTKAELKARWLTLYKVYEKVQTPPLPTLRQFCGEKK